MRLHVVIAAAAAAAAALSYECGFSNPLQVPCLLFLLSPRVAIWPAHVLADAGEGEEASVLHDDMNVWLGTHALGWVDVDGALRRGICWDREQISRAQVEQ